MAQARLPRDSSPPSRKPFFSPDNALFWLIPGIGLLIAYAIFPLIYNLYVSFHEWDLMGKEFDPVAGENWTRIWNSLVVAPLAEVIPALEMPMSTLMDSRIQNSISVTFQYVFVALIIQLVLGLIIALLLDAGPWGAGLMQSIMILPMVIAPAIVGMMFRLLLHSELGGIQWFFFQIGITSVEEPFLGGTGQYALAALIIVDVWQWTPFFVIILLAGLKGLPSEIIEAASVDGANFFQRLFQIKLPLLRRVLLVAVLFRLIDLYRVYDYVHVMTSGGPANKTETLSYYSATQIFNQLEWGYGATLSITILIIAWMTAFAYQKLFRIEW
jgi:multiple sugar transport system permease protein